MTMSLVRRRNNGGVCRCSAVPTLVREGGVGVRREPISKSCEITQADNLNRRRRLSRKAQ